MEKHSYVDSWVLQFLDQVLVLTDVFILFVILFYTNLFSFLYIFGFPLSEQGANVSLNTDLVKHEDICWFCFFFVSDVVVFILVLFCEKVINANGKLITLRV